MTCRELSWSDAPYALMVAALTAVRALVHVASIVIILARARDVESAVRTSPDRRCCGWALGSGMWSSYNFKSNLYTLHLPTN